jgi:hypothetical protein
VEIAGLYNPVPGAVSVDAGRVSSSIVKGGGSCSYGGHQYDDLVLMFTPSQANTKIVEWVNAAEHHGGGGTSQRRNICIRLYSQDKSAVLKTINCYGCFPASLTSSGMNKRLTCNVDRIEVA